MFGRVYKRVVLLFEKFFCLRFRAIHRPEVKRNVVTVPEIEFPLDRDRLNHPYVVKNPCVSDGVRHSVKTGGFDVFPFKRHNIYQSGDAQRVSAHTATNALCATRNQDVSAICGFP